MDEQQIRKIAEQVYNEKGTQYGVPQVPYHTHNGTDSPLISASVVQTGTILGVGIETLASETFAIKNVLNPSRVSIYGIAANNADGTPATKRAVVNGEINFGRGYLYSGTQSIQLSEFSIDTNSPGTPFLQSCNSLYTDSTDLTKTRVTGTNEYCVLVKDNTGTNVATLTMTSYQNNSLQFTSVLSTNWQITVFFTIV